MSKRLSTILFVVIFCVPKCRISKPPCVLLIIAKILLYIKFLDFHMSMA